MWRSAPLSLFFSVVALIACGQPPVPSHLAGLTRTRVVSGLRASRLVRRMHGKAVAPADTTVAVYGRRGQLTVWLSRYRDSFAARRALDAMLRGLRGDDTPLSRPSQDPNTPGRWTVVGGGRHHVFWVAERNLYWLEGEPATVFRALDELPGPTAGMLL